MSYLQLVLLALVYGVNLFTLVFIIFDARNASKALGYMLLVITVPVIGPLIYFSVGINYRQRKIYNKKLRVTRREERQFYDQMVEQTRQLAQHPPPELAGQGDMVNLLLNESQAILSFNRAQLLLNGEEKFPRVLEALAAARHHIHLEYYIYEDDRMGNQIKDVLVAKAREGIKVRFIYDAFGSQDLSNGFLRQLRQAGVEVHPFSRIYFVFAASRINYRNHRKVIIVDGRVGWTGGLNVSDRYINPSPSGEYWRDTHVEIEGPAVHGLQRHFLADWNFCAGQNVLPDEQLFPTIAPRPDCQSYVQIVTSGPDYPNPTVMLSFFTAIVNARQRVYLTTPYFIPNNSINDALKKAALSGKDVRLLVPQQADSKLITYASQSYYAELLECGVQIYEYNKGFIHAKTILADDNLAIVSTANLDFRSFELNFEFGAVIYGPALCAKMMAAFENDLRHSRKISLESWQNRGRARVLRERLARLFSPLL